MVVLAIVFQSVMTLPAAIPNATENVAAKRIDA
jgi:hypothetical protein